MILVIPVYSCAFHNRRRQNPSKSLKIYHENTKRVDCREYLNEVLNEPGLPDFTTCAKSLDNQGIPTRKTRLEPNVQKAWLTRIFLVSLVSLVILRTRKTRLKPGSWNSEWTTLTRLEPYVQKAWLTRVFLVSLARLVNQALPGS